MESKIVANTAVVRLDKGEEVISSLLSLAKSQGITCADVRGIGASDDFSVGVFDSRSKKYVAADFSEPAEITSLVGNLTTKDGENYAHLHANFALQGGKTVGGHLTKAVVSVTCELFVTFYDVTVERRFDENIGVNLMKFED